MANSLEAALKTRTRHLALDTIRFVQALPSDQVFSVLGKQLVRSATSVGANYRAACRGRSDAEMLAKLGLVEEEADESMYWLELIDELMPEPAEQSGVLMREFTEIVAICVASRRTLKRRIQE